MAPITAACSTKYKAAHTSGRRFASPTLIILHSTEGPTAEGAAAYFANPASAGSAHLVVDDNECFKTVDDNVVPWAAPGANMQGFHIEQAGYAGWSWVQWMRHRRTVQRAAYKAATRCARYGIPAVWLSPADLKAGKHGISTHANCTKAFGPVGGHTDPGERYPRFYFMRQVRRNLKNL